MRRSTPCCIRATATRARGMRWIESTNYVMRLWQRLSNVADQARDVTLCNLA
jgi:hypothetical protein